MKRTCGSTAGSNLTVVRFVGRAFRGVVATIGTKESIQGSSLTRVLTAARSSPTLATTTTTAEFTQVSAPTFAQSVAKAFLAAIH